MVGWYDAYYHHADGLIASLGIVSLQLVLLLPQIRFVMTHQTQRWWVQKQRYHIRMPVRIMTGIGNMEAETYDISESGAFVMVDLPKARKNLDGIGKFTLNFSGLSIKASLIRFAVPKGNYPSGVGIRFEKLSGFELKSLKMICATHI